MEKLIHTAEGELIEDNPYRIGRNVRRLRSENNYTVPAGAEGKIIPNNIKTDRDRVRVDWGVYGNWNTRKKCVKFID